MIGEGRYTQGDLAIEPEGCFSLAVGDLNGDSYPDLFAGNEMADQVFINSEDRSFLDSGGRYGSGPTAGVTIGDMDGDGDLDVVAAGWGDQGHVWANDTTGHFTSRFELDTSSLHVHAAELADYEGDGDLDVFFAVAGRICCRNLWINDGTGVLVPKPNDFGSIGAHGIAVIDLDLDGFLDVILAIGDTVPRPSMIWLGNEDGFEDSGIRVGEAFSGGIATGT